MSVGMCLWALGTAVAGVGCYVMGAIVGEKNRKESERLIAILGEKLESAQNEACFMKDSFRELKARNDKLHQERFRVECELDNLTEVNKRLLQEAAQNEGLVIQLRSEIEALKSGKTLSEREVVG